jgi:drug/metabolite transporter (DMT)-like permease
MSYFILLLLGAIWGASYMFIKVGGAEIPPFTFVEIRTLVAALTLAIVLLLRHESIPRTRRAWLVLIAMGIFNGVIPYTAITWGETHISSGLASILTAAMPLFTVIFAHFWSEDERLTLPKSIGIALGFIGVVVLFVPELRRGIQIEFWGQFAIVIAAASYGLATLIAHKYLNGISPVMASTGQLATAALFMLPLSLAFDNPFALRPSLPAIGSLLILSLLGTAFAYILYYWLIEHTGATRTALVTYLIPITGVMWGALLLSEPIEWEAIVGLALIIAGVALVNRSSAPTEQLVTAAIVEGDKTLGGRRDGVIRPRSFVLRWFSQ